MPKFTVILGQRVLKTVELDQDIVVIGRHPNADIFIDNSAISRKHCRVYFNHGAYVVEDLGSVNGVALNGRKVKAHFLTSGDEIQLSKFTIRFEVTGPRVDRTNQMFMPDVAVDKKAEIGERTVYVPQPDNAARPGPAPAPAPGTPAMAMPRGTPYLKALGGGRTERYSLGKQVTVLGKSGEADVPLSGLLTASHAASIVRVDRDFWLKAATKLGAGVKVNGEKVREHRLKDDDLIQIGDNYFTFKAG